MADVTGTGSATNAASAATSPTTNPKSILGKDDFLKLMVTQLQNQDPLNPTDDKDFMGQMAQFTSVEQLTNMATAIDRMSTASQSTQSIALIGKTVTYKKDDETTAEGVATSVAFGDDGAITIAVGDDQVKPNQIVKVK